MPLLLAWTVGRHRQTGESYHMLWITKVQEHYLQGVSTSCYNKLTIQNV